MKAHHLYRKFVCMERNIVAIGILCSTSLFAQVTLNNNVIPQENELWGYHDVPYVNAGPSVMGSKWDYSNLPPGVLVPYNWSNRSLAPRAGAFPDDALVLEVPGDPIAFYQAGDTAFYWLGTYSDNALVRFDPPLVLLDLPCSINSQWADTVVAAVTGAGRIEIRKTILKANVDGWGSLIMPYGVVDDVIRIRYDLKLTDADDYNVVHRSEVRHVWYTDLTSMPLLVISDRKGWSPERTLRWLDGSWQEGPNRLFEPIQLRAFPDPCDEIATVDLPATKADRTVLQLIDGQGNVAKQWLAEFTSPQTRRMTLQMNDVPSGTYTLTWMGTDGVIGSTRLTRR